jgi:holo-[acyl-carrier protein] synthase
MIINLSIDIIEIKRIKNLKDIYKFKKKILNKIEYNEFNNSKEKINYMAKIFCIKESLIKSLGTGLIKNLFFNKIKIYKNNLGKLNIENNINILISISHDNNIIISIIIIFH